jgi:uncharacterized protein
MEATRPVPQPITPESKPYWEGLKAGKLLLPKCGDCAHVFFYPRVLCPRCRSRRIDWIESSGRGRLHSFGIAHQSINRAFKVPLPYVLALVELEEGPRMMSNLVEVEPDPSKLKCDMPVEVVFTEVADGVTLPLFRPAGRGR